ncbi:hypothetical protein DVR09_15535 (plasmid) [Erythrobacter aureus]|uniref:Uncharacterized protein n=2 Tax=Erythrobacter aureus TaxID=2182384 RepID=A0A345YIW3_9SPHN|nr:hypothetical protein DVR09_15535 [Erythrobacter aureus]
MPFVFKISLALLIASLVGGQAWQHQDAAPGWDADASALRAECPAMGGPEKIDTLGDVVRLYDAYAIRLVGGAIGFNDGCAG